MTLDQVNERALRAGLRTDQTGAVWGHVDALHRYSLQLVRDAASVAHPEGLRDAAICALEVLRFNRGKQARLAAIERLEQVLPHVEQA
jgi:hypothetical protein